MVYTDFKHVGYAMFRCIYYTLEGPNLDMLDKFALNMSNMQLSCPNGHVVLQPQRRLSALA